MLLAWHPSNYIQAIWWVKIFILLMELKPKMAVLLPQVMTCWPPMASLWNLRALKNAFQKQGKQRMACHPPILTEWSMEWPKQVRDATKWLGKLSFTDRAKWIDSGKPMNLLMESSWCLLDNKRRMWRQIPLANTAMLKWPLLSWMQPLVKSSGPWTMVVQAKLKTHKHPSKPHLSTVKATSL